MKRLEALLLVVLLYVNVWGVVRFRACGLGSRVLGVVGCGI